MTLINNESHRPFTNSTPEFFDECIYHCEKSWLPVDGETDQIPYERHCTVGDDGIDESEALHILWPTEYTACPCNPLYSMNPEMEVAHVD